jgi:hypothetical protein
MSYSTVIKALVCALAIPVATASGQLDSASRPKWSLSLGADPTAFDLRTRDPGVQLRLVGNLSRVWQNPGSRFSRNISLMVGGDSPLSQTNCYGCWSHVGKRYVGLTGGVAADLARIGRFTPYVQTGAGVYYTRLTGQVSGASIIPNPMYTRNFFSLGVNGGLGIKAKFGSHEFFVEQMLHAFDIRQYDKGVYPLNFGIRF